MSLKFATLASLLCVPLAFACTPRHKTSSLIKTREIPHSPIKKQLSSNCWIFAGIGWTEALIIKDTNGKEVKDYSELYLYYQHMREQLLLSDETLSEQNHQILQGADFAEFV